MNTMSSKGNATLKSAEGKDGVVGLHWKMSLFHKYEDGLHKMKQKNLIMITESSAHKVMTGIYRGRSLEEQFNSIIHVAFTWEFCFWKFSYSYICIYVNNVGAQL